MKSISADLTAALAAGTVVIVTLVRIEFASGTVALNSSTWTFDYDGDTYRGAYGLGTITPIDDHPGELPGVQLRLDQPDTANLSVALDADDEVQGAVVEILTAFLDRTTMQVVEVERGWLGSADTTQITEDGESCFVTLTCESKGVDLLKGNPLLYNDADQQTLVPGDRAFEFAVSDSDKNVAWPLRDYFFK